MSKFPYNTNQTPTSKLETAKQNVDSEYEHTAQMLNGKYKIIQRIGSGGMGQIFRAEQLPLGRTVAIKVMRSPDDPEQSKRFFLEAALAAQLTHPNTIRIFDYGQSNDGIVFIVMEFLEGYNLKQELPVPPLRLIKIAKQICSALAEAHEKNIIHRDIKPSNIFVTQRQDVFAKLLDFGLVKSLNSNAEISQSGLVLGSPIYMSPEQVESKDVGYSADIYSLGMTLYHALAGKPPFSGEVSQVLMAQLLKMPPRIQELNPNVQSVPPLLEWIIFQAIQKDPSKRFRSTTQFYEALEICERSLLTQQPMTLSLHNGELRHQSGKAVDLTPLLTTKTKPNQSDSPAEQTNSILQTTGQTGVSQFFHSTGSIVILGMLLFMLIVAGVLGGVALHFALKTAEKNQQISTETTTQTVTETETKTETQTATETETKTETQTKTETETTAETLQSVTVDSKPPGARLYIGEGTEIICQTPCEISVQESESKSITLRKKNYRTYRGKISGKKKRFSFSLKRKTNVVKPNKPDNNNNQEGQSGDLKTPSWAQ